MKVKIKDMTVGAPLLLIVSFALPLMVGNIFQQLYTVVDTMVVGKALGVDALAALGATDWLYWMLLGMIQGVTQGFGILMISSELPEVINMSDNIVVMREGRVSTIIPASEATQESVLSAGMPLEKQA